MITKQCWKCREHKDLSDYGKDSKRKDLKNPMCKVCVNAASLKYRAGNPEKRKATTSAYRATNIEKCRAAQKNWYEKDPENAKEIKRQWVANNNEKSRAIKSKWRAANYKTISGIGSSRRSAIGTHTADQVKNLFSLQRGKCAYCKSSLNSGYHKDHIVPLKLDGSNFIENIQLLCPFCNLSKGAKHPIDYAQEQGRLL